MSKTFLFALLLAPAFSFAQEAITETGSAVSAKDAQKILDHHNKARKELSILPLTWSPKLAAYAQAWADSLASNENCPLEHRQKRLYGENIFMSGASPAFDPLQASMAWYSEKEKYTYGKIGEGGQWDKTLHYTQMIWEKTTEMGVGMATCANGNIIIVANYNPAGNRRGEYPYDK